MIVENNNNEMIAFANQVLIVTQSLPVAFFFLVNLQMR